MGEIIYSIIQLAFCCVEIYLMVKMHQTKNDSSMDVNVNIYNLMLGDVCALYFIMRTFFG